MILCASCGEKVTDQPECSICHDTTYLADRFKLLEEAGAGSFGTTFLALRIEDQQRVAIKEMMVRKAESLKVLELFEREVKTLESLEHHGIPRFYEDFVIESGRNTAYYLVQEFIDGQTLWQTFQGPTTAQDVVDVSLQILDILEYLHNFVPPVIHRDIKPQNVLRQPDGRLVLIDFGSVKLAFERKDGSTIAGTFGYMAPEQFLGQAFPQTDIYALGALMVALLTKTDPQLLLGSDRLLNVDPIPIEDSLKSTLKSFLAADPKQRPNATEARAKLLERTQQLEVVPTSKLELQKTPQYLVLQKTQHRAAAAVGSFVMCIMVGFLTLFISPTLVVFVLPLMAITLVLIITTMWEKRHVERLVDGGARASGLVTDVELVPGEHRIALSLKYQFEADGKTYKGKWGGHLTPIPGHTTFHSQPEIPVAFDVRKPEDHVLLIEANEHLTPISNLERLLQRVARL